MVIDTGLDPVTAEREQWTTATTPWRWRRAWWLPTSATPETNDRLTAAGVEVLPIAAAELGTGRGGPRCMSCPVARDPL